MADYPNQEFSYTFQAKKAEASEWMPSAGRWDEPERAASAAAIFMLNRALLGELWTVELISVYEWSLSCHEPLKLDSVGK